MLEKLPESTGNVLGYLARAKITDEELTAFAREFEAAIERHGKTRLLVYMPKMPTLTPGALWDDLKLFRYRNNIERYAVVSDSPVFGWTSKVADALSSGEVRQFDTRQYEEAWRWLEQPVEGS
ncbi:MULTISPECIES: STAS/SEC14 domain-containing protein [Mycolicibacterium]|uniref:STAS/SEC14 domain-containing protein n=1 Tax=Mycolicibacterium TaxID=1866885 RepID=UPI001CA3724C|nr:MULTISPECIES: STAS/SEC14 domain-containing protein [Mycolicibacterium]QZT65368.1 STAS/SEC14 domain-containing protein [Mycolicibacterium austroafricanum]